MRVFDFTHAIVREPGNSVVDGLRADTTVTPDLARLRTEHAAYVAALRGAGLAVDVLPPLEAFPDSIFVEDPALVFGEGAIVLRPGAPSRLGEAAQMRAALVARFPRVETLEDDAFADGGDILVLPDVVFIGLSARTNLKGAYAVQSKLASLGRRARIVETPRGVLHFKTAVSLVAEDTVLATPAMRETFAGFRVLETPPGEEAAANALRVNDTVFVGAAYPRTAELLRSNGFAVTPLDVREIAKLDAGLSCLSLRWRAV
jgi:dimethylargininase